MAPSTYGRDTADVKLLYEESAKSASKSARIVALNEVMEQLQNKMYDFAGQFANVDAENDELRAAGDRERISLVSTLIKRPFMNNRWAKHRADRLQSSLDSMTSAD